MSPTETAAVILTGVFIMAMVAIAVQTAENQRRERQLQLLAIRNQIRGTEHLLDSLPLEFQTQTLRSLMIQTLRRLWLNAAKLDRSINTQEHFQKLEDREKDSFTPPAFPGNQLTLFQDRNTAQRNRSLVRETAQFIIELKQKNLIGADSAQQQLVHLKYAYQRCNCDLVLLEAQSMLADRGAHVAIHRFRTAVMQLRRINYNHQLEPQILQLQLLIQQLEAEDTTKQDQVTEAKLSPL
ncbi:hypothetical protein [Nitrincola schmidtii]|uniref:hypothetical protein n=1 Tax=Nitrincola schmidtii TaxID=1730894 RepID=UPI00124F163C|nr:hypothetical protein [Nitrincola schmidtii]